MTIDFLGLVLTFDKITAAGALLAALGAISVLMATARDGNSQQHRELVRQRVNHTADRGPQRR